MGQLQHAQQAGHAYRATADHGIPERHRRAVRLQEQSLVGAARGCLTAVVGGDAAGLAIVMQQEGTRSEEHTSELQSLMRISYAVFCLKKKKNANKTNIYAQYDKQHTYIDRACLKY